MGWSVLERGPGDVAWPGRLPVNGSWAHHCQNALIDINGGVFFRESKKTGRKFGWDRGEGSSPGGYGRDRGNGGNAGETWARRKA